MSKNEKMISFKDLARASNVSVGTLSRYFNNGPVSEKNRNEIKKNIIKYGYIKNKAASMIRKKNTTTIIIRTFIYSSAQDIIIEGIIKSLLDKDIIIRYSKKDEKSVLKEIDWAIEQRPKHLIVFPPINQSIEMIKKIEQFKKITNISFYDFKNDQVPNVSVSYENVFKKISKKIKEIYFVYSDNKDKNSFLNRLEVIKKYLKVKIVNNIDDVPKEKYCLFQSEKLRNEQISSLIKKNKKVKNISISYRKPLFLEKNDIWIFVDYFRVGVQIVSMILQEENNHIEIKAEIAKNNDL